MISYRKFSETTEQKIQGYEKVVNFYEKNREGRFQNKSGLKKILNEIDLELGKKQTNKNRANLYSLYNRLGKFI